jgi:hypothetical protein
MPSTSLLEISRLYWDRDIRVLPAQVGIERTLVETKADLCEYNLEHIQQVKDTYFPFYTPLVSKTWPIDQKDATVVDRIFLDLDIRTVKVNDPITGEQVEKKTTFEEIWSKGQLFYKMFWPNIELFFSGGKGFHIYLYILPTTMGELRQHRERLFAVFCTWFQYLHDKKAFLSLDRICRTTLTKHSIDPDHPTRPKWKVPIEPKMDLPEILRQATYPDQYTDHFAKLYQREPEPLDYHLFLQSPDQLL